MRTLPLALGLVALGCYRNVEVAVSVVTPDGGDPFVGADAATEVRVRLEGAGAAPQTARVASNGAFTLPLDLGTDSRATRLIVEALAGGMIVGSGATPPAVWSQYALAVLPVFVQRRDSLVPAPPTVTLATPRRAPQVVPLTSPYVAVLGGADAESPVDVFDLLALGRSENTNPLRSPFVGELQALALENGKVLVLKGCQTILWDTATNTFASADANVPPPERCELTRSTLVADPRGGGYLVGGLRMGAASPRVDRVLPTGRWVPGVPLAFPRAAPSAVHLRDGELLVAGGQADVGATALERYSFDGSLAADRRPLRTGNADVDARAGATLAIASGNMGYLLGGAHVGTGAYASDDAVLDLACLDQPCALLLRTAPLLTVRRRDAFAAVAEGDQVVVAGGLSPAGAVESIERVDGSAPRAPVAGGLLAASGGAGVTLARVSTGSVLMVGGGQRAVWFFRH